MGKNSSSLHLLDELVIITGLFAASVTQASFRNCYHVQECQRITSEKDSAFTGEVDRIELDMPLFESTYRGISRLPLSPVKCCRAIKVDMEVNRTAIEKGICSINGRGTDPTSTPQR